MAPTIIALLLAYVVFPLLFVLMERFWFSLPDRKILRSGFGSDVSQFTVGLIIGRGCLAYCLMTNHSHLIIETPAPNLAQDVRHLNVSTPNASTGAHCLPSFLLLCYASFYLCRKR